jgi:hypothetical protein
VRLVLEPLAHSGAPAAAAAWAAGAAVLPWIVRGRSGGADLVLACAWTAAIVGATVVLMPGVDAAGTALGAAGAVLLGVALRAVRGPARGPEAARDVP